MKPYHLRITFDIRVMPWRINNPATEQSWWAIQVWDENIGEWVYGTDLKRPGESCHISNVQIINDDNNNDHNDDDDEDPG